MTAERDMLFLSHAWENNDVTQWLALQLARDRYGVWCDLTKLLGGENWPSEINNAIKARTQKFLFVLSRSSNKKDNTLGELELARSIAKECSFENFIIPLRVDDIQKSELDFRLQGIEWVDFMDGWYAGMQKLSKLFERDGVIKNISFGPPSVNSWWSQRGSSPTPLVMKEEPLSSNKIKIISLPETFFIHVCNEKPQLNGFIKYPIICDKNNILSFNSASDLKNESGFHGTFIESHEFPTSSFVDGSCPAFANETDSHNKYIWLLNQAFEKFMQNSGLFRFKLSHEPCYYFHRQVLENGRIIHTNNGELNKLTKLWGKHFKQHWHFALGIRAILEPTYHYLLVPHLLISGGRRHIYAASASVTSDWKNAEWRDSVRAAMLHLSKGESTITLLNVDSGALTVETKAEEFISPITYQSPNDAKENK